MYVISLLPYSKTNIDILTALRISNLLYFDHFPFTYSTLLADRRQLFEVCEQKYRLGQQQLGKN
jgi:hypothetical protein